MSLAVDLMGVGLNPEVARRLGASALTSVTTAGTTQGTATAIPNGVNNVLLVTAGSQTGAILNSATELDLPIVVTNSTATTGVVYPPTGGAINSAAANAGVNISQNESATFVRLSSTRWISWGTANPSILGTANTWTQTQSFPDIKGSDASFGILGNDPATTASAGGAVVIAGNVGGSVSGAGGLVSVTGGAGTTNAVGGVASLVGGAGAGTGAGAAAVVTGGASGAGATGNGGAVTIAGGASLSTAGTGGAVTLTGGVGTTTGLGGAITETGGAGGNAAAGGTGAAGGATSLTSGAGGTTATGTGGASGAATLASGVGGAATGAGVGGAGGAVAITGGAGGATTTSTGGAGATITQTAGAGGAASGAGTGGAGGNLVNQVGAGGTTSGGTTGVSGSIYNRFGTGAFTKTQGSPTAKTVTDPITAAQLLTGIITTTGVTAPSVHQLPDGTTLDALLPGIANNDAFDFCVINTGTGATTDATVTVNTGVTIVGSPTIGSLVDNTQDVGSGLFRMRRTGTATYVCYRIA